MTCRCICAILIVVLLCDAVSAIDHANLLLPNQSRLETLVVAHAEEFPWQVNRPIAKVTKTLWREHPSEGVAVNVGINYAGPNLELREYTSQVSTFDQHRAITTRLSTDNGRTWSPFKPTVPPTNMIYYEGGVPVMECQGYEFYDSQAGVLTAGWLRNVHTSLTTYWRLSRDNGATWSIPKMFRYEPGDEFNAKEPMASNFLKQNQGYFGNSIIKLSNGNILTPLGQANSAEDRSMMSSLCMIGTWNASKGDYQWKAGKPVTASPAQSTTGLLEPDAAELKDRRVLVTWRCEPQGWKYFSVSTDGGLTLSPPAELKYDDGTRFHSSASYHRLLRNSATGKLYWIGNITGKTKDTWPRYPLVIAEVNESGTPSLKKNTVTVIDDKQPNQTTSVQFSNFSLFEDRETHAFNLFLTAYGESSDSKTGFYNANCYKYVLTFVPQGLPESP
jgi:hypothetical protein